MIPQFPKFVKLSLQHEDIINKYTLAYPPYCDFNFIALWCYNINNETDVSILNNNLVIRLIDCHTNESFISFFGKTKFEDTSIKLLDYCIKNNISPTLKVIPEVFVDIEKTYSHIAIVEDRHNHDYVYDLHELSELKGKKFNTKRYLFKKFNKLYPLHNLKVLDITDSKSQKEILGLFQTWQENKGKDSKDTKNEHDALTKLLHYSKKLDYICIGIFSDNELIAFTITELVHLNYAIVHFAKTNYKYTGINEALYKYLADELLQRKFKYINFEQDLGLENLRYAKTLWNPVFFLKKFTITRTKKSKK